MSRKSLEDMKRSHDGKGNKLDDDVEEDEENEEEDTQLSYLAASNSVYRLTDKTTAEKIIEIIDLLKALPRDQLATIQELEETLMIDIRTDQGVLDMLQHNPIIHKEYHYGILYYQYIIKYEVRNKEELFNIINQVKTGIIMAELINSNRVTNPLLEAELLEMIEGGEIIAIKNKDPKVKSAILFPRGIPFYCELSGTVTTSPGTVNATTSDDLTVEIRRGEAVRIGRNTTDPWFRVSTETIGVALERSKAQLSVTNEKDLSDLNRYAYDYNSKMLPLSDIYVSDTSFEGKAYKHGVTNDIKKLWRETMEDYNHHICDDETKLLQEIVRLGFNSSAASIVVDNKRRAIFRKKKERKPRRTKMMCQSIANPHLIGSELEKRAIELRNSKEE